MVNENAPLVTKVEIKNFKCIHDLQLELSPLTVLIGKNDTGKTSILEAIGFFAGAYQEFIRHNPLGIKEEDYIRHGVSISQVKIEGHFSNNLRSRYKFGNNGRYQNDQLPNVRPAYKLDVEKLRQSSTVGSLNKSPLPEDGENFADAVDRVSFKTLTALQKDFTSRIPYISEFRCDSVPKTNGRKQVAFDVLGEGVVSSKLISDGALLILGYLIIANDENRPPLIMIEEPENGIHPRQLQGVMELFKSLTTGENPVQVIMTTHSPFVLDCVPPESVRVCTRDNEHGVQVHKFSEAEPIKALLDKGFTLGEAWFNFDEDKITSVSK